MSKRTKHRGLAVIEFILIVPIMLIILVALFEIGRIFIYYTTLNKAVQNGARFAVVNVYGTSDPSTVATEDKIQNIVVYGNEFGTGQVVLNGLSTSDVTLDPDSIADHIIVSAVYDYSSVFLTIPFTTTSFDITLNASATMRNE